MVPSNDEFAQSQQGLHYQISPMGHIMDPYKMRIIIVTNLFCDTIFVALKYINIIYPKAYELLSSLVSLQSTTYHQNLHKFHLNQMIIP